ncbi:MAG TPA: NINE protein [Terracidiphilus sp.]|nr:NINE protein [Terracidiphilus sp.]
MTSVSYPSAQAVFYQQYETVRRDEVVGVLLALFLGTFGVHHFYLRRTGLGILYCVFFWTGVPTLLGFIECFFMPGRVREFNAIQAAGIAAALGIAMPGFGPPVNVTVNMAPGTAPAPAAGFAASPAMGLAAPGAGSAAAPPAGTLVTCPRCQRGNPAGSRFCGGCGQALS